MERLDHILNATGRGSSVISEAVYNYLFQADPIWTLMSGTFFGEDLII